MRKATIIVASLFLGIGISAGFLINVSAEEELIPSWIKNTASFWVDDQISDSEFIAALQFLVEKGILVIPQSEIKEQKTGSDNYYQRGDEIIINGIAYKVSDVYVTNSLPGAGIWEVPEGAMVLVVAVNVKNVSDEPLKELRGFSLMDSEDRKFTGKYAASISGDYIGTIQAGLEAFGPRLAIFVIPFDDILSYYLIRTEEGIKIHLGDSSAFYR